MVESTGLAALCPRPQMEAAAMVAHSSSIRARCSSVPGRAMISSRMNSRLLQAFPAGGAFAAGFFVEERDEIAGHVHHATGGVHDDHAAGAHDGAHGLEAVVVHRQVQELSGDAAAGGAAGLDRLEFPVLADAAAQLIDDLAQAWCPWALPPGRSDSPRPPGRRPWCPCSFPCRWRRTSPAP